MTKECDLYHCSRQHLLSVWLAGSMQVGATDVAVFR